MRFSRDKRGYEYIYLFHEATGRGSTSRPRVLYWYRTPPGVKVGREPFDEQVRQALEAQNPELLFDWTSIMQAQAPPLPEAEPWRERRRAERSAKQARTAEQREQAPAVSDGAADDPLSSDRPAAEMPISSAHLETSADMSQSLLDPTPELEPETSLAAPSPLAAPPSLAARGRRRRRGGRRGSRAGTGTSSPGGTAAETPVSAEQIGAEAAGPAESTGSENPDEEAKLPSGAS